MKLLLKALLILAVVFAVTYASSPWWIPTILARQLPADWHLETLEISWPGLAGINVKKVQVKGDLPGFGLNIEAENSRLSYRGFETQVDSAVLHVYLGSSDKKTTEPFSIENLSLPMFQLSADLPAITVKQAQLAIQLASEDPANNHGKASGQPIMISMQNFRLEPSDLGQYQLATTATIVGQENINGLIDIEVKPDKLAARVRFPADGTQPSWLDLVFSQAEITSQTASEIELHFDPDATRGQWLDTLLNNSSEGRLTHVGGKLQAHAIFNGAQTRQFSQGSISTNRFQIDFDGDTAVMDVQLNAQRNADNIYIDFSDLDYSKLANSEFNINTVDKHSAGRLSITDRNVRIETLLATAVPELNRSIETIPGSTTNATFNVGSGSRLTFSIPDNRQSGLTLGLTGDLGLNYINGSSGIQLDMNKLTVAITDLENTAQLELNSNITLNWVEDGPFSYTNAGLSVAGDSVSLQSTGQLVLQEERIEITPGGSINAHLPGLKAKIQTGDTVAPAWIELTAEDLQARQAQLEFVLSGPATDTKTSYLFKGPLVVSNPKITIFSSANPPETIVTAGELNLTGSLGSNENQLISSGSGILNKVKVMPLAVNATQLDLNWADLNLLELTGTLAAKTQGFKIKVEDKTWTGFDLDAGLELLADEQVKGKGNLSFGGTSTFPIEFSGNSNSGWWDIELPGNSVPVADIRGLLKSAKMELPTELKLAAGSLGVAGTIEVHDEISASLDISGTDIAANLAESDAQQISFHFEAGFTNDVFAYGPLAIGYLGLAGGIDITEVRSDLNVRSSDTFGLGNLSATLFDGQLSIKQLNYADSGIEDTTISLVHINLQKLLRFLDIDGLDGTGFIDFSLPAGSQGNAVHITDGTFTSTGPGRLSYSKGDIANANIGLQALDNFHYKELSGKIAYNSIGPYTITLHLEGSNPDLYDGYPLVFNLTINGSLPELFEAMFMTGSFEDSILKQVKLKEAQ